MQSKHKQISSPLELKNLSVLQLKHMLKNLQTQHNQLQAKNDQLTNHINDIREVIRNVNHERQQQIVYERQKQEKLKNQIQKCKAALNVSHKNNYYSSMLAFKD